MAKGFSQIPGLDFTEYFSQLVNDMTFQVVITSMVIEKCDAKIVDIDNAFINGELDHEIYMAIPEGYTEYIEQCKGDEALKLDHQEKSQSRSQISNGKYHKRMGHIQQIGRFQFIIEIH